MFFMPTETFHKNKHAYTRDDGAQLFSSVFKKFRKKDELKIHYSIETPNWFKFEQNGVETLFTELNVGKATGPYNLRIVFLENIARSIS